MEEKAWIIDFYGISFNVINCLTTIVACVIVFLLVYFATRNLSIKPNRKQNMLEWVVDFVRGIISGNIPWKEGRQYHLLAFTFFTFVLVSNLIGLALKVVVNEYSYWKSPTADPLVTLTMAMMVIVLTHAFSIKKFGVKKYFQHNFLEPVSFLLPMKVMEEFTSMLTLALRLYGNIYAGEVLLTLIASFGNSAGVFSIALAIPLQMVWQAFSMFIGAIQAYIFTLLFTVYLSHKVIEE